MKPYECPNDNEGVEEIRDWLPFAKLVTVSFPGIPFPYKGVHSQDSVIVIPFRRVGLTYQVGIIKEKRPLFHAGWLSAFPAGKIEDGQSPEEAARLESLQEAGMKLKELFLLGSDMPFLHICDETVYTFIALVDETGKKQTLEKGEMILSEMSWMNWNDFRCAILEQQLSDLPLLDNSPMDGMSRMAANKMLALRFNPEIFDSY